MCDICKQHAEACADSHWSCTRLTPNMLEIEALIYDHIRGGCETCSDLFDDTFAQSAIAHGEEFDPDHRAQL